MCRNTWHILKACKKSTKLQYLFQLMVKMNTMKIPDQQVLDLKRSPSITSDSYRKQTLGFQEDIGRMRSKACPTINCLCIWIIHIHIVTSHQNRVGVFKIHHKDFSISFKCYSFKYVCSNLPTIFGLRIVNVYVCKVHSLQSVCQHQFHTFPKVCIR